jgi:hypothetical protein
MHSPGEISDADPIVYAFKADGTSQRFSLAKGDGFLRPQNAERGLPGQLGEKGLWQVCDLDGTTGDIKVAGAGGVRKVLEFNGPVDGPNAATITMPYVKVESFLTTPATKLTVALWLKLDAKAGLGLGTILSYATAASPTTFNINNVKALQICAGGECGVTTDVSLLEDSQAANADSPGWIHVAVTWDATAPANPGPRFRLQS